MAHDLVAVVDVGDGERRLVACAGGDAGLHGAMDAEPDAGRFRDGGGLQQLAQAAGLVGSDDDDIGGAGVQGGVNIFW